MAASTGGGWAGVRRLLARAIPSRSALPWYSAVLVGFPALNLAAARLHALLPLTLVTDTGPLGEEFGWRGFARRGPHSRRDLVGLAPAHVLHPGAAVAPALHPRFPGEQRGVERDRDVALPANARRLDAHDPGPRCRKFDPLPYQETVDLS